MVACAAAATLGLTACGGTSSQTGASGTPIKVMTITPVNVPVGTGLPFPEIGVAAQAAVNAINKAGGIKGHPIQLTVCDNKFNENQDAACARQAVTEGDVALIGGISAQSSHFSVLEQAGIPVIGDYGASDLALNSPIAFPFVAATLTFMGCMAELADMAHAKRVALLTRTQAALQNPILKTNLEALLAKRGAELVGYDFFNLSADYTATVANALKNNPDAIYLGGGTADQDKITKLLRQLGPKVAIARTLIPTSSIRTLGADAEGMYVCDPFKPPSLADDPNVKKFVDAMKSIDSQAAVDTVAANTWAAMYAFAQLASTVDSVTSKNLLTAISTAKVKTLLGPTIDFSRTIHPELGYKHIYNFSWSYNQIKEGIIVNINNGQFVDPLA
jgi:ABC-type branched-subunit amino acid transport system substrate-binding protein